MGWSNNSIFQVVIIPGSGGGLFVYNGAPGVGNLIFSVVAPGVTKDPFGNTVSPVLNAGNLPNAITRIDANGNLQILSGGSVVIVLNVSQKALFYYSPNLGAGNLTYSIAQASGTDAAGNAYLPGATTYKKITGTDYRAYQVDSSSFNLWTAGSNAGPWNLILSGGLNLLEDRLAIVSNLTSGEVDIGGPSAALAWSGAATGDSLLVTKGTGATGGLLEAINTNSAPANIPILFRGQGATDRLFGVDVAGDTSRRLTISAGGTIATGGGSSAVDTQLFRASANLWASDFLAFNQGGAAETWNGVTFANSWTNAAGQAPMSYRLTVIDSRVEVIGRIVAPAGVTFPSNITAALPTAYRPTHTMPLIMWNISQGVFVRAQIGSGGVISIQAGGGGVAAGDNVEFIASTSYPVNV